MAEGPPYVLGIDCGTQSLRSAVFDLAGSPVAQSVENQVRHVVFFVAKPPLFFL